MLSVGVATMGMTCLVGYASAANTAPGDLIPDSMLVAQGTAAPGGKGGGAAGETGRADKGSMGKSAGKNTGMGADTTIPEKAKPGPENTGPGGNTASNSGKTGGSSGSPESSKGPTVGNGSSETSNSGSRPSSSTGGEGK